MISPRTALKSPAAGASGNTISGCYVGTNAAGTVATANTIAGISLKAGAHNNTIGGTTAAARNIISGNTLQGVLITDAGTNNNVVTGNFIGLDRTGTVAVPNADSGVGIFNGAQSNIIGGTTAAARNVISGNTKQGVYIGDPGSNGNQVMGNYLGTNPAGTAAIPNVNGGVVIQSGAQANTIGGTVAGAGNLISGNTTNGVFVGFAGTSGNVIQGNFIGTTASGTSALPNTQSGVSLYSGAQANLVGGTAAGAGNLISGNTSDGVFVGFAGTSNNTIQGNLIGTNATGTAALANGFSGVDLYSGAQSNLVGGTGAGAGNVISGNANNSGVFVGYAGTDNNTIQGNLIGLNRAGTGAVPNNTGVSIYLGPKSNLVGGTAPGAGNVISGNLSDGVFIGSVDSNITMSNTVAGNLIGLDPTGLTALGNGGTGVDLYGNAQSNTVGGPGARNFISGNQSGIYFAGQSGLLTGSNLVQGNTIGLNVAGNPAPNAFHGVVLYGGATNNVIGGSGIGAANLIAGNASDGILLQDAATVGNTFRRNSIFRNGAYGIQLFATTPQSAPSLTSAQAGLATTVIGSLTSTASSSFRIEFFATPTGDASFTAGRYFVGETTTNTNSGGVANFNVPLGARIPAGYLVTVTATNAAGSTSEFSNTATVSPAVSTVGDGIPDAWKSLYGFSLSDPAVAGRDVDGTGMTNLQKFKAGLNPLDAHSFLRVTSVARSGNDFSITFPSVSGIVYRVEHRVDLGSSAWTLVADQILGTGSPIVVTDPQAALLPQVFYRVAVQP